MSGPEDSVIQRIHWIRGQRMILEDDLADIYGVVTKALKRAVRRNLDRFPSDFLIELSLEEATRLRCQIGTSKHVRGGVRVP